MVTARELSEIQKRMEEEHRKDREALQRLARFMNREAEPIVLVTTSEEDASDNMHTIISKVAHIMESEPSRKWTVPTMLAYLRIAKFPMNSKTPEATLNLTFKKLKKRGQVTLLRQGMGRRPSIYRWSHPEIAEGEKNSAKSERATQGQPDHVQ